MRRELAGVLGGVTAFLSVLLILSFRSGIDADRRLIHPSTTLPSGATGGHGSQVLFERPEQELVVPTNHKSVELALRWLAAHQSRDGGWNFNHGRDNGHQGPVRHAGANKSRTEATAVCLAGFLFVGQTHRNGKQRDEVAKGLKFLLSQAKKWNGAVGDFRGEEGGVIAQAWATLVLAELYAQTQDKTLLQPVQDAVDVLAGMAHPRGGWGSDLHVPADTLSTAYAVDALRAAHLAYLKVPAAVISKVNRFLGSVQSADGARYGLLGKDDGTPATHAAGMLCLIHLGCAKNKELATRTFREIHACGPLAGDLDNNYFALRVLQLSSDAKLFDGYRERLQQQLTESQVMTSQTAGEQGSWVPVGPHAKSGGRLYATAMNLILLAPQTLSRQRVPVDDDF